MNTSRQSISSLIKVLESLRDEHLLILSISQQELELVNDYEADLMRNDFYRIQHSTDKVNLAIEDAQVLSVLSEYLKVVEAERKNNSTNILKLNEEGDWLRDEVTNLMSNLRKCEEKIVELEEQNKHLKFLLELKSFEDKELDNQEKNKENPDITKNNFSIEDGDFKFPESEYEKQVAMNSDINQMNTSTTTGFDLPPRLKTLHNLVIQYAAQGRYEVAIPLCKQTLEDLEKNSGRNHPDVATMLNILALVYRDQNKYSDALTLLKEALNIRENTLGPVHLAVAANLNNLAVLYGKQKKFNEAEPLCKRSLIIREQLLGINHPDVAKQLNNLALLCQNQGKYVEAEEYYLRAIKIYTDTYGKDKDDVIKSKINLATAFMKQGKFKEAELMYKEVLNVIHESLCGEIAPNNKPIWLLAEEKQYGIIGGNFNSQKDEKDSWDRIRGKNWSSVYTTLKNLAALYRQQNKTEAADILDTFANENQLQQNDIQQNEQVNIRHSATSEKIAIAKTPHGMGQRTSSGYVGPDMIWSVQRTNQMKSNLMTRPNNLNKNSGPVKPFRTSMNDNWQSRLSKSPNMRDNGQNLHFGGNDYYSNGNGRMKKASSMSLLPSAPQKTVNTSTNSQSIKQTDFHGQTWLSRDGTASIENIKKAFGKRT